MTNPRTSSWEIRQGDALELLREIETASIDAVVTDPPYGERVAAWDKPREYSWYEEWILECDRILKPNAPLITFCSRRRVDVIMGALRRVRGDAPDCPLQTGAWVHRQGHPTGAAGWLRPEHEPFIVSGLLRTLAEDVRQTRTYRSTHNVNRNPTHRRVTSRAFKPMTYTPNADGPMAGTVFEGSRNRPGERLEHKAQKPTEITEYLVLLACPPGGLVVDPFAGTATTGIVCARTGRSFVGIELLAEHVAIARKRYEDEAPLFRREVPA